MLKHLLFSVSLLFPFLLRAQENVGVGTVTPAYRLDVQSNPGSTNLINVNSKVNYAGNLDIRAFDGTSVTADGFGIGGKFTGGYRGVEALSSGGAYNGATYGIFSQATGTIGTRIGVYGTASGATNNYGIQGIVNGGANHYGVYGVNTNLSGYAGYFNGRGFFTQELRADKNMVVDDSLWTHFIVNQSGIMDIEAVTDIEIKIDRTNGGTTSFFEILNGLGEHLFHVNELGNGRSYGNHFIDGNLGIGTLTTTTKFQILGGADASLTTHGYAQFGPTSSWNLILDDNEIMARSNGIGGDLLLQQDDGNILMVGLEQGQVGIGVQLATNLPTGYMLAVDGKIIGEELRIQNSNNWPDYVFAEDYKLMPIDELKNSIEINNHLPNIPSALEVQQEGILVGDMQKRMMEKIEELTLYIIDLNEINKKQQGEIDQLKIVIAQLKNSH